MDATQRPFRLRATTTAVVGLVVAVAAVLLVTAEHDGGAAVIQASPTAESRAATIAALARQTAITPGRPTSPFAPLSTEESETTAVADWHKVLDESVTGSLANAQAFAVAAQTGAVTASLNQSASSASAAQSQIIAAAAAQNQNAAGAATLAAAARAQVAARTTTSSTSTVGVGAGGSAAAAVTFPTLPPVPAPFQALVRARVCPPLIAARARVIARFNDLIARFPDRAAQFAEERDEALANINAQLARFGCTLPSTGT